MMLLRPVFEFFIVSIATATLLWPCLVLAHEVDVDTARSQLMIPELMLLSNNTHPHIAHPHIAYVSRNARPGGGQYTCDALNVDTIHKLGHSIRQEFDRVNHVRLGLDYLILCDKVTAQSQPIGGIPVPPLNLLMLSVSEHSSPERVAHLLWHELFHYLEFKQGSYRDQQWDSMFSGYENRYDMNQSQLTRIGEGSNGFINKYGQSFPHEERAEIFALLMISPAEVTWHLKNGDQILAKKVDFMKNKIRKMGF